MQSTAWPGLISSLGNWLNDSERGFLMGIFAGCCNTGNILGYILGMQYIDQYGGTWYGLVEIISVAVFLYGIFISIFFCPNPDVNFKFNCLTSFKALIKNQ